MREPRGDQRSNRKDTRADGCELPPTARSDEGRAHHAHATIWGGARKRHRAAQEPHGPSRADAVTREDEAMRAIVGWLIFGLLLLPLSCASRTAKRPDAAPTHRNSHGWPLFAGQALARRFLATAPAQGVEGAFYLVEMQSYDAPTLDLLVSVCTDNNGHLGDISKTALDATLLMIGPPGWERLWVPYRPGQEQSGSAPRLTAWKAHDAPCKVDFAVPCKLNGGSYYWIVIEPNWLPQSADEPVNFVVLLTERSMRPTTIHRVFDQWSLLDRRLDYSDHRPGEGRLQYSDYTRNEDIVVNITLDRTHESVGHLPPGKK
jgi:hypothetical protein